MKFCIRLILALACVALPSLLPADEPGLSEIRHPKVVDFPPVKESEIAQYTAYRTPSPIQVDGKLAEASWSNAQASSSFVVQQQHHCSRFQNVFHQRSSNPFLKASLMLSKLRIIPDDWKME